MELTLFSSQKCVQKKVESDHYWYDHVNKVMLHGRGGRMEFRYDPSSKQAVPILVDAYEKVYQSNIGIIDDWVKKAADDYGMDVIERNGDRSVTVELSATKLSDVLDSLYRLGVSCDYDEREMKKEIDEWKNVIDDRKNQWQD